MPSDLHQHRVLRTFRGSLMEDTSGVSGPRPLHSVSCCPCFCLKDIFFFSPTAPPSSPQDIHLLSRPPHSSRSAPGLTCRAPVAPHYSPSVTPWVGSGSHLPLHSVLCGRSLCPSSLDSTILRLALSLPSVGASNTIEHQVNGAAGLTLGCFTPKSKIFTASTWGN